jgi:polyribonucleotide nucleotidyltransferase
MKVLDAMNQALAAPRAEMSQYAPRIETIRIPVDKIGLIIGPGGKTIKGIVAETGAEINIEDDGSIHIYSSSADSLARAKQIIEGMTKDIEIGSVYQGRIVTIKEFGCFVEVLPGKDGMVHISELADFRINRVEDILKVGELIWVKCVGVDEKGRVKLSRRAAMQERGESMGSAPAASMERGDGGGAAGAGGERRGGGDRGDRGPRRDDRGGDRGPRRDDRGGERREPRLEQTGGEAPAPRPVYPEYRPGDSAPQP